MLRVQQGMVFCTIYSKKNFPLSLGLHMEKNNCGEFVATLCMVMSNCSGLAFLWGDVLLFGCMVNYGNRISWTDIEMQCIFFYMWCVKDLVPISW
jgi:hypothetical protein